MGGVKKQYKHLYKYRYELIDTGTGEGNRGGKNMQGNGGKKGGNGMRGGKGGGGGKR